MAIDPQSWVASFEAQHPALFARLREAGWQPGAISPHRPRWAAEAERFVYNDLALQLELELGGTILETVQPDGGVQVLQFAPGRGLANLKRAANDYDLDVHELARGPDPFPVAEGHGWVLFVTGDGRSVLIAQALNAYVRADDPFVLLDLLLTGTEHRERLESEAVAQGVRVTGRPNT